MTHGTVYSYGQGCRCDACRKAKTTRRREQRARARAANSPSYQHELAAARALKETYRGVCEVCGEPTTGCDGPGSARTRCFRHAPALVGLAKRGVGPTVGRVLALLDEREMARVSEIISRVGITRAHSSVLLNRLLRYGLIERVERGVYRKAA